jgi:hypothetical protein
VLTSMLVCLITHSSILMKTPSLLSFLMVLLPTLLSNDRPVLPDGPKECVSKIRISVT